MVRVSEGLSHSQARVAKVAHSHTTAMAASLVLGAHALPRASALGSLQPAPGRAGSSVPLGPLPRTPQKHEGPEKVGVGQGLLEAPLFLDCTPLPCPHLPCYSHTSPVTAPIAPGSKEVPTDSDAPSRHQAHTPLYLRAP